MLGKRLINLDGASRPDNKLSRFMRASCHTTTALPIGPIAIRPELVGMSPCDAPYGATVARIVEAVDHASAPFFLSSLRSCLEAEQAHTAACATRPGLGLDESRGLRISQALQPIAASAQ
jgi:hypothetical protein